MEIQSKNDCKISNWLELITMGEGGLTLTRCVSVVVVEFAWGGAAVNREMLYYICGREN